MKCEVRPFIVVERHIPFDGSLIDPWFLLQVVQTFFLDCSVESFQMGIVIGFAYSGMPMSDACMRGEPLREF